MEIFKTTGRVKFFDWSRGYGFIAREGIRDIMLHRVVVQAAGLTVLERGTTVEVEYVEIPSRGLQCVKLCSIDTSTAGEPAVPWEPAIVKWYDPNAGRSGMGFVTLLSRPHDALMLGKAVQRSGVNFGHDRPVALPDGRMSRTPEGVRIDVQVRQNDKGYYVIAIRGVDHVEA